MVQATDGPSTPYRSDATFTVSIDATEGEFLDGNDRALWAGTLDSGETFVIGHVDYILGATAKDWGADPGDRFFTGPTTFETIDGVEVRTTEPTEGDNLGFTLGAEEMLETVEAVIATEGCVAG